MTHYDKGKCVWNEQKEHEDGFSCGFAQFRSNKILNNMIRRTPYASAIGSLIYAMFCTKPDISHVVREVGRYMDILEKLTGRL